MEPKYEINFNYEAFAIGASNCFGSFFHAFPVSSSLGRSSLQYSAGGRSQVASLVACSVLLLALVVGGRYFAVLPKAVLATIIFVNMALVVIRQVRLKIITGFISYISV